PNMPDVDTPTLAGAISTATHGSGQNLGAMHSYMTALTLVTGRGEVLTCSRSRNPEVFDAARVSLGSLGVITEITLQNVPAHNLKRRVWLEPMDALIERFDELVAANNSFEMYYIPFCDSGVAIAINPTDEPVRPRGAEQDNDAVLDMRGLRNVLDWWPGMRRWLLNKSTEGYQPEEAVDVWHRIFPSSREVRFNEMEYHLPREQLLPTLKQVRERLESRHPEIFFPIEVRVVKGDDAWLSPFAGHATSGSIALHQYHLEDPLPYFADFEPLYQPLGGRPHWGKMNTLGAQDFAQRYPRWRDFLDVRAALDPDGKMLNPYLKKTFGLG
ncbi:MAG: FAD-binding protein, partial [Hydrocarboniphaga effusa]|nr:FAD-binding protein [Hydrocarboniphaga effusa]